MKKTFLILSVIALVICLMGIPVLIEGIAARGFAGVNYGRVVFPLVIGGVFFWLYKKPQKS